jgi:hypothetical protein
MLFQSFDSAEPELVQQFFATTGRVPQYCNRGRNLIERCPPQQGLALPSLFRTPLAIGEFREMRMRRVIGPRVKQASGFVKSLEMADEPVSRILCRGYLALATCIASAAQARGDHSSRSRFAP